MKRGSPEYRQRMAEICREFITQEARVKSGATRRGRRQSPESILKNALGNAIESSTSSTPSTSFTGFTLSILQGRSLRNVIEAPGLAYCLQGIHSTLLIVILGSMRFASAAQGRTHGQPGRGLRVVTK